MAYSKNQVLENYSNYLRKNVVSNLVDKITEKCFEYAGNGGVGLSVEVYKYLSTQMELDLLVKKLIDLGYDPELTVDKLVIRWANDEK